MNKNIFSYYIKFSLIAILIGLAGCNSFQQSAKQATSSFKKLIIFKKQVTAQERRIPQGNKKYISTSKTNNESDHSVLNNAPIDEPKKSKSKFFKRNKESEVKKVNLSENKDQEVNKHTLKDSKKLVQHESHSAHSVVDIPANTSEKPAVEEIAIKHDNKESKNPGKLSRMFRKNKPVSEVNQNTDVINNDNKQFPDLHSVPEAPSEVNKNTKPQMQQDLINIQNEAKQIQDNVKNQANDANNNMNVQTPIPNEVKEIPQPSSKVEDNSSNSNQPTLLKEIDESGFYTSPKKPASNYIMDNNKNADPSSNRLKLLPSSRYSN